METPYSLWLVNLANLVSRLNEEIRCMRWNFVRT